VTPTYEATTTVLVNQTQSPGIIQYNDVLTSQHLTSTYAELAKSRPILSDVILRLHLNITEKDLAQQLTVSPVRDTQLLRISAENRDPGLAADIANTTAAAFIDDNAKQTGNRPGTVSVSEPAIVPNEPAAPNVKLNTAMVGILGLLAGAVLALVLEYLDDTIKTARDIEEVVGLPTLGTVSRFRQRKNKAPSRRTLFDDQGSEEDYRRLRTNVHFAMLDWFSRSILVTSAHPGEGKSTTAAHLASVLAQAGHSVVLVDADLRRPMLHEYFATPNSFGLTGLILSGGKNVEAALVEVGGGGLKFLASGPIPANPSEVLASARFASVLEAVKKHADYVIL